jgi:hypothetical protein
MPADRTESNIAVANDRNPETTSEPDAPGFDIRFTLDRRHLIALGFRGQIRTLQTWKG